jgi:hypothetical protein
MPRFSVGEAMQYKHTDRDSLLGFLTTLQGELETEMIPNGTAVTQSSLRVEVSEDEDDGAEAATVSSADSGADDVASAAASQQLAAPSVADGFKVVQSKASKAKAKHQSVSNKKREENNESAAPTTAQGERGRKHAPHQAGKPAPGKAPNQQGKKRKGSAPKPQGFASFTRERARGRYAALADMSPDSDSDGGESMDEGGDDAPYAYVADAQSDTDAKGPEEVPDTGASRFMGDPTSDTMAIGGDMDIDCDNASSLSGYVGSSGPSQPES